MTTTILNRENRRIQVDSATIISGTLGAAADTLGEQIDALGYQSVSVQVFGTFVATLTFEVSNDGVNWRAKSLTSATGSFVSTATGAEVYSADLGARYFRVRVSAYTSGTPTVFIEYSPQSQSYAANGVTNTLLGSGATGGWKVEDNASASGDVGIASLGVRGPTTPAAQTSAAADYGFVMIDAEGKQVGVGMAIPDLTWESLTNHTAATTDVALRAAQAAGIRTFLKMLIIENTGAGSARLTVRDGTTAKASFTIPAGQTLIVPFEQPLRGSAATALNAQIAAVGTVTVTALGFSGV